jgi:enhancing lycopene biosynthesis protein 2
MADKRLRVAVVLSGCGHLDGSEIQEAVATLYHVARLGAEYECFAPDLGLIEIDHLTGHPTGERRNMLAESARLARGAIRGIDDLAAADFEALIFPGGYGAAKNLSDFAFKGPEAEAQPEVAQVVRAFHAAGKPIGVLCIASAMLAAAFKGTDVHPLVTVGETSESSDGVEGLGARHEVCPVEGIVVDAQHKIVSTPAYMYDATITDVFTGIGKLVETVLTLARAER